MQHRGTLFAGLLLILTGLYFLLVNLTSFVGLGWAQLWPGFLVLAALAFLLPIAIWWEQHRALAGLAVPGVILLSNALFFFYNAITGDWGAWAYLWSLEPLAVALGLVALWLLGVRQQGLLIGAAVLGAISLGLFVIFGSLFGGHLAVIVASIVLIALGLALMWRGAFQRQPA